MATAVSLSEKRIDLVQRLYHDLYETQAAGIEHSQRHARSIYGVILFIEKAAGCTRLDAGATVMSLIWKGHLPEGNLQVALPWKRKLH